MVFQGIKFPSLDILVYLWLISQISQGSYIGLASYALGTGLIKIAILLQLRRLVEPASQTCRANLVTLVVVGVWTSAFSFMAWFPCFPIRKVWSYNVKGHCYAFGAAGNNSTQFIWTLIGHSGSNMALDLFILGLTMHIMWLLNSSQGLKMRLAMLLSIGVL